MKTQSKSDPRRVHADGTSLVEAELRRLDLPTKPQAPKGPHHDIIVAGRSGSITVKVGAITKSHDWQFDISKFVDVQMDGKRQVLKDLTGEPHPDLFVLVVLTPQRFFVLDWKTLQEILVSRHKECLERNAGIRPNNENSFHVSLPISQVEQYESKWSTIARRVVGN